MLRGMPSRCPWSALYSVYKKSTHNDVLLLSIDIRLYDAAVGYGARSWVIHQQLLAFAQIGSLIIGPHKPGKCIEGSAQTEPLMARPAAYSTPESSWNRPLGLLAMICYGGALLQKLLLGVRRADARQELQATSLA